MKPDLDLPKEEIAVSPLPRPTKVLVAEDHVMVRDGLVALLNQAENIEVIGAASDFEESLAIVKEQELDVVVMDMFLKDEIDSSALIRELMTIQPHLRILVISMHREEDVAERAARAGAHGFINKAETADTLIDTVRGIAANGSGFSERVRARLLEEPLRLSGVSPIQKLTAREVQVFRLVGSGLGLSEIAARLDLSPKTVAAHRENLKNKLGCHSAGELAKCSRHWLGIGEGA